MKLLKKALSVVCALSMLSTMAVAAITVHAIDNAPTLSATLNEGYNSSTGEGQITLSVSGLSNIVTDYNVLGAWQADVVMDETVFDATLYKKGTVTNAPYKKNEKKLGDWEGTFYPGVYDSATQSITVSAASMVQAEDTTLCTINFKVLNPTKKSKITIANAMLVGNTYNDEGMVVAYPEYKQGSMLNTVDVEIPGSEPEQPPTPDKPSVPENTGTTADSSTIKAFNPKDLGLTETADGYFTPDADYANANDRAIAVANNFGAPGAFNKIKWTMSRTPVGDVAETASLTKQIAHIDTNAAITVGMVVGFDITEYSAVSITNVELINE